MDVLRKKKHIKYFNKIFKRINRRIIENKENDNLNKNLKEELWDYYKLFLIQKLQKNKKDDIIDFLIEKLKRRHPHVFNKKYSNFKS